MATNDAVLCEYCAEYAVDYLLHENVISDAIGGVWDAVTGFLSGGLDRVSVMSSLREGNIENADELVRALKVERDKLAAEAGEDEASPIFHGAYLAGEKLFSALLWLGDLPVKLADAVFGDVDDSRFWGGGLLLWLVVTGAGFLLSPAAGMFAASAGAMVGAIDLFQFQAHRRLLGTKEALAIRDVDQKSPDTRQKWSDIQRDLEVDLKKFAAEHPLGIAGRAAVDVMGTAAGAAKDAVSVLAPPTAESLDEGMLDGVVQKIADAVYGAAEGFFLGLQEDPTDLVQIAEYMEQNGYTPQDLEAIAAEKAQEFFAYAEDMPMAKQFLYKVSMAVGNALRRLANVTVVPVLRALKKQFSFAHWDYFIEHPLRLLIPAVLMYGALWTIPMVWLTPMAQLLGMGTMTEAVWMSFVAGLAHVLLVQGPVGATIHAPLGSEH
jgi:hypothetical protein